MANPNGGSKCKIFLDLNETHIPKVLGSLISKLVIFTILSHQFFYGYFSLIVFTVTHFSKFLRLKDAAGEYDLHKKILYFDHFLALR